MVNDSLSPILKVGENKKNYADRDINRDDGARRFYHITGRPVNIILHVTNNNILQNLPILWEDVGVDEVIYGSSVPHLQGRTFRHKVHHVKPIIVQNFRKGILDIYKKVTIYCQLMQINGIVLLNTLFQHIMFSTVIIIKNRTVNNIKDIIIQVNKLYLQCSFKTTRIDDDS